MVELEHVLSISIYKYACKRSHTHIHSTAYIDPRMALVEAGLFGNPEEGLGPNIRRAFRDFEAWRKARKMQCAQMPWTSGLVT